MDRCARHPLARALRPGDLVLAALQDTALAYLREDGDAIPFWRMATTPVDVLRKRAAAFTDLGDLVDVRSTPGGGTLPGVEIPSIGIARAGDHRAALRDRERPVIARVEDDATVLDLRTIHPDDDDDVAAALRGLG